MCTGETRSSLIKNYLFADNDVTMQCLPRSGKCTEHLHVDATIMRSFQTELYSSLRPSTYAGHSGRSEALAVNAKLERWQHC